MDARTVDGNALRLRELRREERGDLGLGGVALALALVATQVVPELAVPLFVGGLAVVAGGVRAAWRRWDLVDRLAGERDAYVIPEVRDYAVRESSAPRRACHAASIRAVLRQPGVSLRLVAAAPELEALALDLDDPGLELEPAAAVACARLLTALDSPLLDPSAPLEDLHARVTSIRLGFHRPRSVVPRSPDRSARGWRMPAGRSR